MIINNRWRACITLVFALAALCVAWAAELWTIDQLRENLQKNTIKEITIGPSHLTGSFTEDGKRGDFVVRVKYDELPSELILLIQKPNVLVHAERPSGYLIYDYLLLVSAVISGLLLAILTILILIYRRLPSKKEGH